MLSAPSAAITSFCRQHFAHDHPPEVQRKDHPRDPSGEEGQQQLKIIRERMNADLTWVWDNLQRASRLVEHRGKFLTVEQLREVVSYGYAKGYRTIHDFKDEEVDRVLETMFRKTKLT